MSTRQILVFAIVMGLVAAGAVWFLERFQAELLAGKFQQVLRDHDAFQSFLDSRGSVPE